MSYTLKMADDRMRMQSRLEELEKALQRIGTAKKQLGRNTAEAKSRIQCNISRQLEALRNREVWLLNQLDTISGVKEEVLQQQSVRLNKTLGVLQSTIKYPEGSEDAARNIERLQLGDLQPEETPHVSFKSDPSVLREAIMNYGRIDANSVQGIQSPFMDPDHQAPSLPRHFEDYNDAEHHVLYKTVEELNRAKMVEQLVPSIAPKLSSRMEDWLMPATKTTGSDNNSATCTFSFPKFSNNLSDWLMSPKCVNKESNTPIDDLSTDASIQTWLHKIKQCPMEEEEDYEFIEDDSETRTLSSELELFPDPDEHDKDMWLYQRESSQMDDDETDRWLHKSNSTITDMTEVEGINMSRYFTKITDEMDKWLINGIQKQLSDSGKESIKPIKPVVPSTLEFSRAFHSHVSRVDNPWLLRTTVRSSSGSPASSCRSSMSNFPSQHKVYNKWLLNGGLSDEDTPAAISCPIMDKFIRNVDSLNWLKNSQPSVETPVNPMANFLKANVDPSMWLLSGSGSNTPSCEVEGSPFKRLLAGGIENWLQKPARKANVEGLSVSSEMTLTKGDNSSLWSTGSLSSFPQHKDEIEEIDI